MKEVRGPNVFAVSRALWDDPDFADEPMTEREAWVWLVGAAAWKDIRTRGNAGPIDLKRGEFSFSIRFLADKFGWHKSRVERFVERLENRDTIRDTSRDGSKVYSVNNYNRFQVVGAPKRDTNEDTDRDAAETAARQQRDTTETKKKQGKQDNRITGEERTDLVSLGLALTAACAAASRGAEFLRLPTNRFDSSKEEIPIFEQQIVEFQALYPAVDVRAQIRAMKGWLVGNRDRRKTKKGMARFVNSWLADKQNKASANGTRPSNGTEKQRQPASRSFADTMSSLDDEGLAGSLFGEPVHDGSSTHVTRDRKLDRDGAIEVRPSGDTQ